MSARETAQNLHRTAEELRELSDLAAQVGDMKLAWCLDQAVNFIASAETHIHNRVAGRPGGLPEQGKYRIMIPAQIEESPERSI